MTLASSRLWNTSNGEEFVAGFAVEESYERILPGLSWFDEH